MIPGFDAVDLDLLALAQEAYGACTFNSEWAHLLVRDTDAYLAWAFRGTEIERLVDDLTDVVSGVRTIVPGFGAVSAAFHRSCCTVFYHAIPAILRARAAGKKIYGTGHSKGGAEARQATGISKLLGLPPDRVTVWEPARSLSAEALAFIAGIPGIGTRNGPDLVTELPPLLAPEPLVHLQPGARATNWIPFHEIADVDAAVRAAASED